MTIFGSRIKGWISFAGGITFIVIGILAVAPAFVAMGIAMLLVTWATFVLERRTRERYR